MHKEDGGFSLVVLSLAAVLYITITCMTFAGMVVTRPSVGVAILDFAKDYGALLAGIPVLIAVLVAKQQLDASRQQHVATVKRSFQKEIDALNDVKYFAENAQNSTYESAQVRASQDGIDGLIIDRPAGSELKKYREILPYDIADMTAKVSKEISALFEESRFEKPNEQELNLRLSEIKSLSGVLLHFIEARYKLISQYWS